MLAKHKKLRLLFLLLVFIAVALASVCPFITIDPVSRNSTVSAGHSTYSPGASIYQQVIVPYMIAAVTIAGYWELLFILLFLLLPVHRFDYEVPKLLSQIRLRPIKFTTHFVAM